MSSKNSITSSNSVCGKFCLPLVTEKTDIVKIITKRKTVIILRVKQENGGNRIYLYAVLCLEAFMDR